MSFAITPESNERKGAFMKRKWWHNKVAYQIYPKSFLDTNGDGIGDLKGIISKLDYLKKLGIDIIWLSPVYESPFVDQGYDISDYYKIAEQFGTMDDFDTLVAEMKKCGMHLIMDLVVNHCSDKHEWFQKALADPDGPYAGYFYFREGKDGKAPSNYRSYFGGSAWTKVPGTNKYYLHTFAKEQPDLNWENPVVRKKIYEMINWWFEKGISGFRIDAIINIKKNLDFPSFPADGDDGLVSCDKMLASAHGIGTFLEEMKHETFDKYDAFTVGEVFHLKEDELREFIGEDGHFSTKFDFSAHVLSYGEHGWYDAPALDFNRWRDIIAALFNGNRIILNAVQQALHGGKLVVMGGKKRFCAERFLFAHKFQNGSGNAHAVKGGGAPADFIKNNQAVLRGVFKNIGNLAHFNHKGGAACCQIIRRADSGKHSIHNADIRRARGHEGADLRHDNYKRNLAHIG